MRRFEFVEGNSSKFWEVAVDDSALTVRYGRIGTAGTTQTKSYASAAKAQAEHDKLVREKTGKGYTEVTVAAGASLPASAVKAAPTKTPSSAAPQPTAAEGQTQAAPILATAAAVQSTPEAVDTPAAAALTEGPEAPPPGVFLWTPHWRRLLPVLRGVDVATATALDARQCLDELHAAIADVSRQRELLQSIAAGLHSALFGGSAQAGISAARAKLEQSPAHAETWIELFRVILQTGRYGRELTAQRVWEAHLALHGLAICTRHLLEGLIAAKPKHGGQWLADYAGLGALRMRIAASPEDEYQAALGIARGFVDRDPRVAAIIAHLFATDAEIIESALHKVIAAGDAQDAQLLLGCALSQAQADRLDDWLQAQSWVWWEPNRAGLLNRIRLGLDDSLPRVLAWSQRHELNGEARRQCFEIVRAHDSSEALAALLERLGDKDARPLLDAFARTWPQLSIRLAAERLQASGERSLREWLERLVAGHPTALAAVHARADAGTRPLYAQLLSKLHSQPPEAPLESLPEWLRQPLWRASKRSPAASYPKLATRQHAPRLCWLEGERARWQGGYDPDSLAKQDLHYRLKNLSAEAKQLELLSILGIRRSARERLLAGAALAPDDLLEHQSGWPSLLMLLPAPAAARILESKAPRDWYEYGEPRLESIVAWLGEGGVAALERFVERAAERGLELALPLESACVARVAANALRTSKRAKASAQAWLLRHPRYASEVLLPLLPERGRGEDAAHALRWLLANGRESAVAEGALSHGADGLQALALLRAFDPMQLAPLKPPKLPAFWVAGACARPLLRSGQALPVTVLDAVAEMLVFSTLDMRYAGVDRLRELCTPASLGEFAWDLFQSWLGAGAPSKEAWAFNALAHLGDDECARKLALLIRAWPGEAAHARAVQGLDILAAIGSDVALMHLNGIAQKVKFKGLQERARDKIDQLAEVRGLSAEELADRLVPDLGLDADGSLRLDFGPRQFTVGFDEALRPYVRDAAGIPLKELPKPNKSDDATLAEAASERWKALKKDVRTLASQQILHFELAMAQRRRWSAAEFRQFFVEHPLLRHLCRRLLWAEFVDGRVQRCLRVAEDLSYADARDDLCSLDDAAMIGLVHPLELEAADAAAFGQIFADYEILQPFAQLGRDIYTLSDAERDSFELLRFKDKKVATGSVFGLEQRGWRRGDPQDAGWIGWFTRNIGPDLVVELELDPGTVVGEINYEPKQKLGPLVLRSPNSWGDDGRRRWRELDSILASEVLRDLARLAEVN